MELEETSFDFACGDVISSFPYYTQNSQKICSNKVYVIHRILRRVGYAKSIFEKVCSVLLEISPHMDTADVNTFSQLSINGVVVVVRIVSVLCNVVQI